MIGRAQRNPPCAFDGGASRIGTLPRTAAEIRLLGLLRLGKDPHLLHLGMKHIHGSSLLPARRFPCHHLLARPNRPLRRWHRPIHLRIKLTRTALLTLTRTVILKGAYEKSLGPQVRRKMVVVKETRARPTRNHHHVPLCNTSRRSLRMPSSCLASCRREALPKHPQAAHSTPMAAPSVAAVVVDVPGETIVVRRMAV